MNRTFHFLGLTFLVLFGEQLGEQHLRMIRRRAADLEKTVQLLTQMIQEIDSRRADFDALKASLFESREELLDSGSLACTSLSEIPPPKSFQREEQSCWRACFSGLGFLPADAECERIRSFLICFKNYHENAEKKAQQSAAIDRQIGLAAGTMLAILLW